MTKHKRNNRGLTGPLLHSLLLFGAAVLLLLLSRLSEGFAEGYARHIYPLFPAIIGRALSVLPFSLAELLLYITVCLGLPLLAVAAIRRPHSHQAVRKPLMPPGCSETRPSSRDGQLGPRDPRASEAKQSRIGVWGKRTKRYMTEADHPDNDIWRSLSTAWRRLALLASVLLLLFVLTAGINYSRAPFLKTAGLPPVTGNTAQLVSLYRLLIADIAADAPLITTDANGQCLLSGDYIDRCRQAMASLAETYPTLAHTVIRPKAALGSELLSQLRLSGIFFPFTVEAHYNHLPPAYSLPYTVNHELAHSLGYMREEDAGLIAYLACACAEDAVLRYSGAVSALGYVMNACYLAMPREDYYTLLEELPAQARCDLAAGNSFWAAYQHQAGEMARKANDAYLRFNSQPDGVQSYGKMVDLLLAYYADRL